ncbi:hypothetical protein FB567DRAFT_235218 [Paraphoma chrysanthemicola]|uniref:F-box domain-containing protein n=1 Tax=Paraphoma chrysanthemicola TaxID=798071 RepID=A0A8K0RGD6_9PLEO|nr:hypothetical protein FB567DRAFT_235218 [Paraphoma chrysanthemicola]
MGNYFTVEAPSDADRCANPTSICDLPTELIIRILDLCNSEEVARICQTCCLLHDVSPPHLYHTIDLSSHHVKSNAESVPAGEHGVPFSSLRRKWTHQDYVANKKQERFMQTLKEHPALSRHVRSLCWTFFDFSTIAPEDFKDEELASSYEYLYDMTDEGFQVPIDTGKGKAVWQTIESMINVTSVDICWLDEGRRFILPQPLFPSLIRVRLSGIMTREMVQCILTYPARLERLELDNLLQWSEIEPPIPKFPIFLEAATYWRDNANAHKVIHRGRLMAESLNPVLGHCKSLSSLCIATVGNGDYIEWSTDWEDRCYSAWARFIDSTRHQLRHFSFKQGVDHSHATRGKEMWRRGRIVSSNSRFLDLLFLSWILPTLVKSPWPNVQRMMIRGVGYTIEMEYRQQPPLEPEFATPGVTYSVNECRRRFGNYKVEIRRAVFSHAARNELQALLPSGAELVVEEKQEKDYDELWQCDDSGLALYPIDDE